MAFATNLTITVIDNIKLQANTLAELTESTHELTQAACVTPLVYR